MPTLTLTVGVPGCGKSYWAAETARTAKHKTIIVNMDDIRETMSGSVWNYKFNKSNEDYVQDVQNDAADRAVQKGWNIIVADTNLNPKTVQKWTEFAKEHKYTLKFENFFDNFKKGKDFVHDYFAMNKYSEHCKNQNIRREDGVRESVIDRMMDQYYYSTITPPVLEEDDGLWYIIVDVDGTIAHMGDRRSPYDETKVHLDEPDMTVMNSIHAELEVNPKRIRIIVMSGRHETCQEATEMWLAKNVFPYHEIYMRAEGDDRPDDVVKYELYMKHVFGKKKRVLKVFDDRDKVVAMWRKLLGLKVYQVAPGNF